MRAASVSSFGVAETYAGKAKNAAVNVKIAYNSGNTAKDSVLPNTSLPLLISLIPFATSDACLVAEKKPTIPKAKPAVRTARAAFRDRDVLAERLPNIRKNPANPYRPCVDGRAQRIIDLPKMSGFFFSAPMVALPPMVTPYVLPIQDRANMNARPV